MTMQLGINLLGIERTHPGCPFSNLLIAIGDWGDGTGPPTPAASLTPPGDPTAVGSTPAIAATTHPATVGYAAPGTYTILADGVGSLYYGGAFDFTGTPGQSHTVTLGGTGETQIFITAIGDPPLSNLRMIGPLGSDSSFFTPTYLESLRGFRVLRAFDPQIGQGSTVDPYNPPDPLTIDPQANLATSVVTWDQADLRPGRGPRGLCELITALKHVNGTAPDLWINLPYLCAAMGADGAGVATNYAGGLGAYLARHLPVGVQVYVEYVDEPWNFTAYDQYLIAQGNGLGLPRYAIYGALSGAVWDAFEAGFGGNCIRVLNGQNVFPEGNLVDALDYCQSRSIRVDAISPAPYWWISPEDSTTSTPILAAWNSGDHAGALDLFFTYLDAGIVAATSHLAHWKDIATTYGTRLVCYEGGLSVDAPFNVEPNYDVWLAASADARIRPKIASYQAAIALHADLFCWYGHVGLGPWGAMVDLADCGSQRMTALRESMGLPPLVLGDPSYPGDGYGSTGAGLVLSGPAPPTPPPTTATAAFLGQDATTQGSWIGVYGSQGYSVAGTTPAMPANTAAVLGQNFTYAASTSDVRAPQLPDGTGRRAAVWYMNQVFHADLDLTGTGPRNVALYFLDWDTTARVHRVQVMDAVSREILDTRSVSSFSGGIYLTYRISGHVLIEVAGQAGPNVILSGVFLDPSGGGSPTPTPTARTRRWFAGLGGRGGRRVR